MVSHQAAETALRAGETWIRASGNVDTEDDLSKFGSGTSIKGLYQVIPLSPNGSVNEMSGTLNESSPLMQAAFVRELFRAWDRHPEIGLIHLTWLTDVSEGAVDLFLDYYGVADPRFAEYLATLGLRYHAGAGRDKPAMYELRRQARIRGWQVKEPLPSPLRRPGRRLR